MCLKCLFNIIKDFLNSKTFSNEQENMEALIRCFNDEPEVADLIVRMQFSNNRTQSVEDFKF